MKLGRKNCVQGSLTVEACLALPIFLAFFFLLLFFTKIACLNIILDQAVKESAHQIAVRAYPLSFVNDYIDTKVLEGQSVSEFFQEQGNKVSTSSEIKLDELFLGRILTGKLQKLDLEKTWVGLKDSFRAEVNNNVEAALLSILLEPYLDLKEVGEDLLAQEILQNKLQYSRIINPEKIRLTMVKLPYGTVEHLNKTANFWYDDFSLKPEDDFQKDDVVLQLEYDLTLPIPFLGIKEIRLCHTAVERAWLFGGNGVYAVSRDEEGIDFNKYERYAPEGEGGGKKEDQDDDKEDKVQSVYVCKSRTKVYHSFRNCEYLIDKTGVREISLDEAEKRGLRAHGGCPKLFK